MTIMFASLPCFAESWHMWKRLIEPHMIRSTLAFFVLCWVPSEMFQQRIHYLMNDEKLSEYLSHCKSWNGKFSQNFLRGINVSLSETHRLLCNIHALHTHISMRYPKIYMYQRQARNSVLYKWTSIHFYQLHPCLNYSILWHLGKKHLFYSLIAYHI